MSVEITAELLDDLLDKAKSATSGPWDRRGLENLLRYGQKTDGPWNDGEYDCYLPDEGDAEFMASVNPTVIFALVAEIKTLREALAQYEGNSK